MGEVFLACIAWMHSCIAQASGSMPANIMKKLRAVILLVKRAPGKCTKIEVQYEFMFQYS